MNRICDETFINSGFDYDDIVAIRIENGEFYFLGWMEDAEHYKIQMMTDYTFGKLIRDSVSCGSLYSAITECDGYDQHVFYAWIVDDDGNVIQEQEQAYKNVYERFLSFVRNYERNGVSDSDDHDIFCMTTEEFQGIADALRDGDYIFVMEDGINCQ